jgi:hypothetical protein
MHTDEIQFTADFRCVEKLASFYLTLPQKAWSVAEDFGDTLKREGEVRPSRNCEEGAQGMRGSDGASPSRKTATFRF